MMDIPLRHSFTLSGAWKMLFPSRISMGETAGHQRRGVEAGFEIGGEDGATNVNVHVDEPGDVDGLDGSDSDDTSSISDVAEHPRPSSIREGKLHQGLEAGALFESGVEDDGAANVKLQPDEPEEVDGMPQTEQSIQTFAIQITSGQGKDVWTQPSGSVAASVMDPVERARKAMAEFEESLDSREEKIERLKRALGIQIDTVQERKKDFQGIVIQNLEFARKEEVVEEGQGELYDGQDTKKNLSRFQNGSLQIPKEEDIETEEFVRSSVGKSAELHTTTLHIRSQENSVFKKPFVPYEDATIESESTTIQEVSIQTQDKQPSEIAKAALVKEERSENEAEDTQEQIFELDAGDLSSEANNDDGSLHDLPNPVTEIAGQEVPAGKAKTPTSTLQESGLGKQQQCERLDAMWRVSIAYVEPIAGIPNDPHVQTHDPDCSRHELPDDTSNSGGAPPSHEKLPLGTTLQGTTPSQAMITQIAMADPTSFDDGTDSCPHPIESSVDESCPEAATEVATAALLELLTTWQDDQKTSNIGACVDMTKFDKGLSRFTLRTHILFSIVYAVWIAILYERVLTTVC